MSIGCETATLSRLGSCTVDQKPILTAMMDNAKLPTMDFYSCKVDVGLFSPVYSAQLSEDCDRYVTVMMVNANDLEECKNHLDNAIKDGSIDYASSAIRLASLDSINEEIAKQFPGQGTTGVWYKSGRILYNGSK